MTYPIQVVARRTGLSPHVIRIWEKRYGAVVPARTKTQRRVYTEDDVRRLVMLRDATRLGHQISSVAGLPDATLARLLDASAPIAPAESLSDDSARPAAARRDRSSDQRAPGPVPAEAPWIGECVAAVKAFDATALNGLFDRATLALGYNGLLRRLIAPLAQRIGELWGMGELKTSHEHFSSAAIRAYLLNPARQYSLANATPTLVAATPQGQLHELGAVLAAALATEQGWRSIYLGPSLPAAEIAGAVVQNQARVVALSIIYPEDDPNVDTELHDLRRFLPAGVTVVVGGRAAASYRETLAATGAVLVADLAQLQVELARVRATRL